MDSSDWEKLSINTDSSNAAGLEHSADVPPVLHVPIGYLAAAPAGDTKREIFLEIFRVLKRLQGKFRQEILLSSGANIAHPTKGAGQAVGQNVDPQPTVAFRLLDLLDELMTELTEPTVLALGTRLQFRHDYVDPRQIGKYLHLALYQDDGSPVFEGMPFPGRIVKESVSDVIGLAAWVGRDLSQYFYQHELADEFDPDVASQLDIAANAFASNYLHPDIPSVMVDIESANKLYEELHAVERRTPFKPPKCRDLLETIDKLLTLAILKDGKLFGIQNFYNVWESLCLDFAIRCYGPRVFTCDFQFLVWRKEWLGYRKSWTENTGQVFKKNAIARRPDLVLCPVDATGQWTIVDFKYYTLDTIKNFPVTCGRGDAADEKKLVSKHERDITSAEIYRLLLANYLRETGANVAHEDIRIEFWIPGLEQSEPVPIVLKSKGNTFSYFYYRTIPIRQIARSYVVE